MVLEANISIPDPEPRTTSERLYVFAREYQSKGKQNQALKCALEGLKHHPSGEESCKLNLVASEVFLDLGAMKKSLYHAEKAADLALACNNHEEICVCGLHLGNVLARMERFSAAAAVWREVLHTASVIKDKKRQATALVNLANLDQRRGYHSRAMQMLEKASRLMRETGHMKGLAFCNNRMAASLAEQGRYDEALARYGELERLANQLDDTKLKAITFFRRSGILLEMDELNKAIYPLNQARQLFKELGERKNVALVAINLIRTYLNLGDHEKVPNLLREIRTLSSTIDSEPLKKTVEEIHALAAAHQGDAEKVANHIEVAFQWAEVADNRVGFSEFHENLSKIIQRMGSVPSGLDKVIKKARLHYARLGMKEEYNQAGFWLDRS